MKVRGGSRAARKPVSEPVRVQCSSCRRRRREELAGAHTLRKTCSAQEKRCSEPKAALMSSPREEWAAGDLATEVDGGVVRIRPRGPASESGRRSGTPEGVPTPTAPVKRSGERAEKSARQGDGRARSPPSPPSTTTLRAQKPDEGFFSRLVQL